MNVHPAPDGSGIAARRKALRYLAGSAMAGWLTGSGAQEAPGPGVAVPRWDASAVHRRRIGASSDTLPVIGLGTWQSFDVERDAAGRAGARETLRLFAAAGGQLIDSSPMYGSSETIVGELAQELGLQRSLFLATKVWTTGRREGIEQMETSARRLRTPRIDLMQVHNLVDLRTQLETLRRWKGEGRIRYLGLTHYTISGQRELAALLRAEKPDFVQFNYSIATRAAERDLLPLAADIGTAVLINRPFEGGELFPRVKGKPVPGWAVEAGCTSWAQFFLKFVVSHAAVTCAIPATREPRHLIDNMGAGVGILPDAKLRERMAQYFAAV